MTSRNFPGDFIFGVATSSHQIEGGYRGGERGESIWDRFAAAEGNIADGSDAGLACDHYNLWKEDINLMKWLGVGAYRFSVSWPRVIPEGTGKTNAMGLDYYDRLVDGLLDAGIDPFVTLYHWDLPQRLQEKGGWASRDTAKAFVDYALTVAGRLGDRVSYWTTHNEPFCIATLGHENGEHAPGRTDPGEAMAVAHHLLLSHGWAADALRRDFSGCQAGIVLNLVPAEPASGSKADIDAAREFDGLFNRWYLDPLFRGSYPEDAMNDRIRRGHIPAGGLPCMLDGDMGSISGKTDFLGINYYSRNIIRAGPGGTIENVKGAPAGELTDMGWEVYPKGIYDIISRVYKEYSPPSIYITENGAAYSDGPDASGKIRDGRRIDYLREHLAMVAAAVDEGMPVRGYFAWSLLDNFEWAHGYTKRFGLYWVDFDTLERLPKDSAFFYRDVIASRSIDNGIDH